MIPLQFFQCPLFKDTLYRYDDAGLYFFSHSQPSLGWIKSAMSSPEQWGQEVQLLTVEQAKQQFPEAFK